MIPWRLWHNIYGIIIFSFQWKVSLTNNSRLNNSKGQNSWFHFVLLTFTFHCKPLSSLPQFLACHQTLFFFFKLLSLSIFFLSKIFFKTFPLLSLFLVIMLIYRDYRNQIFTNLAQFALRMVSWWCGNIGFQC